MIVVVAIPLLAGVAPAGAQPAGVIQGVVSAANDGRPLPGALVYIAGTSHGVLAGSDGRFRLVGVRPGSHEVTAQHVGRQTRRVTVLVEAGAPVEVNFELPDQAVLLPEMVISTIREAQRLVETAASVGVISEETLRDAKPTHPADVMGQLPGVWVSVTGGEGHMTGIRQPKTTNPVYLFLENGVPTRSTGFFNHNALYEVNVPQAERIEVLKGPATALYGSDAIGGVVNVESRRPSYAPSLEAYLEGGEWGHLRLLLSGSRAWSSDGLRADLNVTRTDGWRDATGYDRQSGTLRWDRHFENGVSKRTLLSVSRIDQQTAGSSQLLRDDYMAEPTINYAPISFRHVRAVRLSSAVQKETDNTLVAVTPYARWNEMEILPNWALTYDPTVYTTGHSSLGVLARVRRNVTPLRARLIAGLDVDYSPGSRLEHRLATQRDGRVFLAFEKAEALYDYDVTFRGVSPYVQAELGPTDRLHVSAGLRFDHMGYRYETRLDPLQTGAWRRPEDTSVSYRRLSPKIGASYDLAPAVNIFANYAHGFRVPSEGQLFRQGQAASTVDLKPVTANSYEAGVRGEVLGRLGYSVSAYRMAVANDILSFIHEDGTRETQNAGETYHRGVETAVGLALMEGLRADLGYSIARHDFRRWRPRADVDYSGNAMTSAPETLVNARLSYSPRSGLPGSRFVVERTRVGRYWMDPENTRRYPGHGLWNLQAAVPVSDALELNARLANALNERFAETAVYTAFRGEEYAPGLPRRVYLGAEYRWQGGAP